ncbi:MAG: hypothetical protein U9N33_04235 [Campylobacterota bacterium]|nr:hypothetical protein [Campylobacterota bacterium]
MGSKNRIYLGTITAFILHHIRNKYAKNIYMSKRVHTKIHMKHPEVSLYTSKEHFILLLEQTIAVVDYKATQEVHNFIARVDGNYILYALKQDKHHTSCSTIFKLKPNTLKKYFKEDTFTILKKNYEEDIKAYIN